MALSQEGNHGVVDRARDHGELESLGVYDELRRRGYVTTPTADESAAVLAGKIRAREPFFYLRYGDGAIECMGGKAGGTRDGELYTRDLAAELADVLRFVLLKRGHGSSLYLGDWMSASFDAKSERARYRAEWEQLLDGQQPDLLHFEALLLMRESAELVEFYRAVKSDPRRKLFMGPVGSAGAAKMLGAEHLVTPMRPDLHRWIVETRLDLSDFNFDVLLYGAGMAGNIPVALCWDRHPERTYVHLGSAMDPLFRGQTRFQQLPPARLRAMFAELL